MTMHGETDSRGSVAIVAIGEAGRQAMLAMGPVAGARVAIVTSSHADADASEPARRPDDAVTITIEDPLHPGALETLRRALPHDLLLLLVDPTDARATLLARAVAFACDALRVAITFVPRSLRAEAARAAFVTEVDAHFAFAISEDGAHHARAAMAIRTIVAGLGGVGVVGYDFADVRATFRRGGERVFVGHGVAVGPRATTDAPSEAAWDACAPHDRLRHARALLAFVEGGRDLRMLDVERVVDVLAARASPEASIVFGAAVDRALPDDAVRVALIATGFEPPIE